jgi:AraC family transcriptional regulator
MEQKNYLYINDININIHSYDLTYNNENWKAVKFHKEYALWYMLEGKIKVKIDDHEYIAQKGDVIFLYPYKIFSCSAVDNDFLLRSVHFDVSFEQSMHMLELIDIDGVYPAEIFNEEAHMFNKIFNDKQYDQNLSKIILKGYILILLGRIFNYFNALTRHEKELLNITETEFNKMQTIFECIYVNINRKITIDELAKIVNLSKNYFCAYFKKVTGMSVQFFIYRAKMIRAKEYIRINRYPINKIASLLGYEDQNAFSKAFKRYYKIFPSKFN